MTLEDLLSHYADARRASRQHWAQIYRVKYGLLSGGGDFNSGPFANETPLVINPRRATSSHGTVAFLASINQRSNSAKWDPAEFEKQPTAWKARCAPIDSIFLLKRGSNHVGTHLGMCDYDCPDAPPPTEQRQWEIKQSAMTAFVSDDHSSLQTFIIPSEHPRFTEISDPRFDERAVAFYNTSGFLRKLDPGDEPYELREGDVLLGYRTAMVYGLGIYPGGLHLDEAESFRPLR